MSDHVAGCDTAAAGLLIADGLNDANFEVRDLAEERAHVIQVTDARAAFCQLTISTAGLVTWEYFPFAGQAADPAQLTALIAGVLGTVPARTPDRAWPGPMLRGAVGRMLRDLGLDVTLGVAARNEEFCEVHADLMITAPARSARGRISLTDEGMIIWECPLGPPQGLTAPDIAATIGRVLSQVPYLGHPGPATRHHLATS
jgi:hypothetical protein